MATHARTISAGQAKTYRNGSHERIRRVLVTGGNGFIASHLIEQLLATTQYNVRVTLRPPRNAARIGHLVSFPHAPERLELVDADMVLEGHESAWDETMRDVQVVFHAAAPYFLDSSDPYGQFVEPIEKGIINVLSAAARSRSVHTVVLTSSMRAIADRPSDKTYDENDWNTQSNIRRNPYFYAKTRGERCAWDFMEKAKMMTGKQPFRLVVINPAMVIGPAHTNAISQSSQIIFELINGIIPAMADLNFWLVDVRDVAKAHIRAAQNPLANGRFVCAAQTLTMADIVRTLKEQFPNYRYPLNVVVPNFAAKLVALTEGIGKASFVRSNVGKGLYKFDNSKIRKVLGVRFRRVEESLWDQAADFVRWGHIGDKTGNSWSCKSPPVVSVSDADIDKCLGWGFTNQVAMDDHAFRLHGWGSSDNLGTGNNSLLKRKNRLRRSISFT